jgi:glycosyltransferase involved in cell wall biosynthesis
MRILMVSTEYPPMPGGVGRYTANLTRELRKLGFDVYVVCNDMGKGEFSGLSPTNAKNSDVLLEIVDKVKPDVVHVQFEPGMYGLIIDPKDPRKSGTYIDQFYTRCKAPITTTFHSGYYTLIQWMSQASLIKKTGRLGRLGIPLRLLMRSWKYLLNYKAFKNLNKEKLSMSRAGIVFSHYASSKLGGGSVIYHGAEPAISTDHNNKKGARSIFSLPQDGRIALALGFKTNTKGWDIIKKMDIPEGWRIVINSSRSSYYNTENYDEKWEEGNNDDNNKNNIIDLQRGFLDEEELSMLFYAANAVILPYKLTAGSGVMFDALAHGLPFIATNLGFFKEFAAQGLGITVKRNPHEFSNGIKNLDRNYSSYAESINAFKQKLKWDFVASQHASIYNFAAGKMQERDSSKV